MAPSTAGAAGAWALYLRLSGFYGGYFLVTGILTPFWPLFLDAKGMTPAQIGVLLTATVWARAGAGPLIAALADRSGHLRAPMIGAGLAALGLSALFFVAEGFAALLAVSLLAYFAYSCIMPLGEAITLRRVSVERDYGRVRLWGSITFIAAAAGGGRLLDAVHAPTADLILVLILAALASATAACALLPDERAPRAPAMGARLRELMGNRAFLLVIAATSLIQASHMVFYGFATLYWQSLGLSNTVIGLLWAEGVLAEILLFAFGARLVRRLGVLGLLALAAGAALARWTIMPLTDALGVFAALQLLHAATFGAMHLGAMGFITRALPASHAVAGQSLYAGVSNGAAMGVGLLLAGWLYGAHGGAAFYSGAGFAALGLIAVWGLARAWRPGEEIGFGTGGDQPRAASGSGAARRSKRRPQ